MITRKVAPALAAGCTVVIKPAELTPLTALAAAELAARASIPAGVLNVLTADSANSIAIGKELCESNIVRHLSFTGSTEVGRILMSQCAPTVKKLSLELGGNAPFLVFDDADVDSAVEGAIASKYRNAGQTCVCANRLYVQEGIYDAFVEKFAARVEALKVGNGFEDGVVQGPLIEDAALDKVQRHVDDAVAKGGKVLVGGHRLQGAGGRPQAAGPVLQADRHRRRHARHAVRTRGNLRPFAPVFRFKTEQDGIDAANNTEFGLASYFYTRDVGRIFRVAEALEYGMVGINAGVIATEHMPFGGVKQSGLGREGSHHGMDDYVEIKYLCLGGYPALTRPGCQVILQARLGRDRAINRRIARAILTHHNPGQPGLCVLPVRDAVIGKARLDRDYFDKHCVDACGITDVSSPALTCSTDVRMPKHEVGQAEEMP